MTRLRRRSCGSAGSTLRMLLMSISRLLSNTIAAQIRSKRGGVENPMGYLIRYVPPFFEGESYRQFVAEENARKQQTREEELRLARSILDDGDAPAGSVQWAKNVLLGE